MTPRLPNGWPTGGRIDSPSITGKSLRTRRKWRTPGPEARRVGSDALSRGVMSGAPKMNEAPRSDAFANSRAPGFGKIGVLLVNLGTPDGTSYWPMRRYLKEFLSDRRVIEINRVLWWVILNGIVLTTRPSKSGGAYRSIWNEDLDESPLRTITRAQSEKVAERLGHREEVVVDWAMRYGSPSIVSGVEALIEQGCEKLLVFPLYPQYAAATTATVNDKVFEKLKTMRWQPALRTVPPYAKDPVYIEALAQSITAHLTTLDFEPEVIIASFHGLPKAYVDRGDPYQCQCMDTVDALREAHPPYPCIGTDTG